MSADGNQVAFASHASNLVAGDTNNSDDVFVRDRAANRLVRVSVATDGSQAVSNSLSPSLSATGRHVAFLSHASNLVPNDTNNTIDVFVRDRDVDGNGIFDEPGAVRNGDGAPSVRRLARQLGVSPSAVHRAIRALGVDIQFRDDADET